ncbi:hypothetical protein [Tautonia sociabilis]|uniref:Uncharacterized protein n=1 Tax=Tautonia sociabilis TaxID=2080755 RepID=A0A432MR11_9BACT|nr:hypothetical protein [Tautonia sociabilis]RUL89388.1 hypothetical protein TsocGM_02995 [Tautonia sociabilis]
MEQIYYTQCPMGYGLGASNGFQIKRIGAGYPASGDVRHLAFRAFLPGSNGKVMAPGTLRYRRVGTVAEVAWLEPRAREYETERGQWGRPGGHFAHGIRLDPDEFEAIAHWPAGLFGLPLWRRSDPEPSRGRRPDDLVIGRDSLAVPPDFEHVAPLVDLDPDSLALLLAAVAEAVRSNRALFLIDAPDRLGPRIAALTFAFPSALRGELTLSTYHDRPEELSGFRIQGTVPSPLLNRAVLAGLGPIADLAAGRFEPATPPPSWARSLAAWLTRREPGDADDWTATEARCRLARLPDDPAVLWSDAWLDGLIHQAEALRSPGSASSPGFDWARLSRQASWADAAGLSSELADACDPSWWENAPRDLDRNREAKIAFWTLALSSSTWPRSSLEEAAHWGVVASRFWSRGDPTFRSRVLARTLRQISPVSQRSRFLDGLIRSSPAEEAHEALDWLDRSGGGDPEVLLPLRARLGVRLLREQRRADALESVVRAAIDRVRSLPATLDLIADEAGASPEARPIVEFVCGEIEHAPPEARSAFERWALARTGLGGQNWLAPAVRLLLATEIRRPDWDALRDRTPEALRPRLATVCLAVASGPDASPVAYSWAVESLVLRLSTPDRPESPEWVDRYLDRIGSPLRLARRLVELGEPLSSWIETAERAGGLSSRSLDRIADAEVLARLIIGPPEYPGLDLLQRLPSDDRAPVLGLLLDRLAGGSFEASGPILERCVLAWPGAFDAGSEGLPPLSGPLSGLLLPFLREPAAWADRVDQLRGLLGVADSEGPNWPPDGIASAIAVECCRWADEPEHSWAIRSFLLRDPRRYRALAPDLRRELLEEPVRRAGEVSQRWSLTLDKGEHSARFFEALLNACDGPRLAEVVPTFARELRTLGPIHWWHSGPKDGKISDARAAFARLVPMAPIPSSREVPSVEAWLLGREPTPAFSSVRNEPDFPLEFVDPVPVPKPTAVTPGNELSSIAQLRWGCIRALTEFHWKGKTDEARWKDLSRWKSVDPSKPDTIPTDVPRVWELDEPDRAAFVAWLILALKHPGRGTIQLESMARWIVKKLGLPSGTAISRALDAIASTGVPVPEDRRRFHRDLSHEMSLQKPNTESTPSVSPDLLS